MCFSVHIDVNLEKLAKQYQARLSPKFHQAVFTATPNGFMKTETLPVLMSHEGLLRIAPMNWSLVPSWSKEYPLKWNTYNARIERENKGVPQKIYQVPSFKDAFRLNKFCLVPIQAAIEACYWGETAGKIISFQEINDHVFMAAGLYDSWINPETNEIKNTCTLLTDGPYEFLFNHGHDRSIIVLDKNKELEFLQSKSRNVESSFEFIKNNRVDQEWKYSVLRDVSEASIKKNTPSPAKLEEIKQTVWS
mgnify:FL=1